eukprot:Sspe_Gene.91154::Locus_62623_Transcript_1_1_Confidence_1.000_Length_592::g.91154::m.91154
MNWALLLIAMAAGGATWYEIVTWMVEDSQQYPTIEAWIVESELFAKAYREVASTAQNWAVMSQLLTFVVPWVTHIGLRSAEQGIPLFTTTMYIWLGFAGAVSIALPLFLMRSRGTSGHPAPREGATSYVAW